MCKPKKIIRNTSTNEIFPNITKASPGGWGGGKSGYRRLNIWGLSRK